MIACGRTRRRQRAGQRSFVLWKQVGGRVRGGSCRARRLGTSVTSFAERLGVVANLGNIPRLATRDSP